MSRKYNMTKDVTNMDLSKRLGELSLDIVLSEAGRRLVLLDKYQKAIDEAVPSCDAQERILNEILDKVGLND